MFNFSRELIVNLDNRISTTSNAIAELEAQLATLRETQKDLEAERQGLLALSQAGESALLQAANFLGAAQAAGREDMVDAFWQGVDKLRAGTTTPDFPTLAPTPDAPTPPDSDNTTVDVEIVPDSEQAETLVQSATGFIVPVDFDNPENSEASEQGEGEEADKPIENAANGNGHKPDYFALSWPELRKTAKAAGIKTHNKNREQLEAELLNLAL